jgi:hypothetical protein
LGTKKEVMQTLHLPPFAYKVKQIGQKVHIYDEIRRHFVVLTPEEWVRQHVVHWLVAEFAYPKSLMQIESGLRYNAMTKRSDLIVYDRAGQPFLLVECKAPDVPLTEATFAQAARYNSVVKAPYLLITNGLTHLVFEITNAGIVELTQMPLLP